MGSKLIGILLFLIILALDLYLDNRAWRKGKPINHFKEWIMRCVFMIPSLYLLTKSYNWYHLSITTFMLGSWWWEFFDGIYNKLRNMPWRYNGSVDEDDSRLDKFLYHLSAAKEALLKWSLIILFTILYIFT